MMNPYFFGMMPGMPGMGGTMNPYMAMMSMPGHQGQGQGQGQMQGQMQGQGQMPGQQVQGQILPQQSMSGMPVPAGSIAPSQSASAMGPSPASAPARNEAIKPFDAGKMKAGRLGHYGYLEGRGGFLRGVEV